MAKLRTVSTTSKDLVETDEPGVYVRQPTTSDMALFAKLDKGPDVVKGQSVEERISRFLMKNVACDEHGDPFDNADDFDSLPLDLVMAVNTKFSELIRDVTGGAQV